MYNSENNDLNRDDDNKNQLPGKKIYPQISPIAAAFIGLFGGFVLYQIVGALLTLIVFGFDLKNAPINGMRLMTMAGQILFILLPALIFAKWIYEDVTTIIRFKLPKLQEVLLFILGMVILTPMLQYYIAIQTYVINHLASAYPLVHSIKSSLDKLNALVDKTYGNLLTAHNAFEGILVILVVSIVPAICEEVMFRGFIQRSFEFRFKPVWAAFITAIFFGLYHFNPYGLIPLIGLGFFFGFAVYKSDSIFVSMTMHFFNNFVAIITFFIVGNQDVINTNPSSTVDLQSSIFLFLILLVLFIGVIYLIRRYYSQKKTIVGG